MITILQYPYATFVIFIKAKPSERSMQIVNSFITEVVPDIKDESWMTLNWSFQRSRHIDVCVFSYRLRIAFYGVFFFILRRLRPQ